MQVAWDVAIEMNDGLVLRADLFLPAQSGRFPVILSYGPYAKGLWFEDGYPDQWRIMTEEHPDVAAGSTNRFQSWEVVDPEKWVPDGYAVVRVDSRGCGRSPGFIDHFSPRETQDLYDCIEWTAVQDWSTGKVGLNGISYYAINQWHVASLRPPHLTAMCVWEGAADWYRDMTHHGGILSTFWANWYDMQVKTVQYGLGANGPVSPFNHLLICGDETLSEAELAANRCQLGAEIAAHPLDDDYHRDRSPDWDTIDVPLLSAGNWGGQGLHLRGNVEGFVRAASSQKWLELHCLEHWTHFYTDYGVGLQKQFFGHFLKDEDNGWDRRQPVLLQVRTVDGFEERSAAAWPLPETRWTELYLDAVTGGLRNSPPAEPATVAYDAPGGGVTFRTSPLPATTEITGPSAVRMFLSCEAPDADLFVVLRVFDAAGDEVTFQGAIDPHTPIGQGWLRLSHRKLDETLSVDYRPYHAHDERQPVLPGVVYEVEVEIWPTSLVIPAGSTIGLTVRGSDYEYEGETAGARLSTFKNELRGSGPFLHDDPDDRPDDVFGGTVTLHSGPDHPARLLVPVIPSAAG
jgi:predicted acyl esterase